MGALWNNADADPFTGSQLVLEEFYHLPPGRQGPVPLQFGRNRRPVDGDDSMVPHPGDGILPNGRDQSNAHFGHLIPCRSELMHLRQRVGTPAL